VIFVIIVVPLCLAIGVAAPFVADRLDRRRQQAVARPVEPS
jgi:hypothetical protein